MKKIKIYLQYPWRFPDSPYYKYLIDNPPENVEYLNVKKQKGVIISKKFFWFSNFLKRNIRRFSNLIKLSIPNAHLTKTKQKFDLIHCAHCLSLNKRPWVADFESEWQIWISERRTKVAKQMIKRILLNNDCKKIIPWTKYTQKKLEKIFPEAKNKIKMVYPAVPLPKIKKKRHKGINLLFVGRYFCEKGGLDVVEVFDILTRKYGKLQCFVISEVPEMIKAKYSKNKKIKFCGLMPQRELYEKVYSESDILVYPGYSDTFGFIILESMSLGIPVVTVNGIARKEIIQNGKTGFVVERPKNISSEEIERIKNPSIIEDLINKTSILIENSSLRRKMSKNCINIIKNGKFSIKERNKKFGRIYEEALR